MENRNYDNNELLNLAVEAAGGTFERSYDNNLCLNRLVVALEAGGGGGSTVDAYTKAESDAKYQEKGDYALSDDVYSKDDADEKFMTVEVAAEQFQPIGDYEYAGICYPKDEADEKFASIDDVDAKVSITQGGYQEYESQSAVEQAIRRGDSMIVGDIYNKLSPSIYSVAFGNGTDTTIIFNTNTDASTNYTIVVTDKFFTTDIYSRSNTITVNSTVYDENSIAGKETITINIKKGDVVKVSLFTNSNALSTTLVHYSDYFYKNQATQSVVVSKDDTEIELATKADIPTTVDAYTKTESDAKYAQKSQSITLVGTDESGTEYTYTLYGYENSSN